MAFVECAINLTFHLGKDSKNRQYTFNEGDYDTVKVTGLRVRASIEGAMPPAKGNATVYVYGLTDSLMNQLSLFSRLEKGVVAIRYNQLMIEAGDSQSGMSTVFTGQINFAQPDYSGAPDSCLVVSAMAGYYEALKSASPLSYSQQADVATIMQTLAVQNGYTFENNGVSVILSTPYLWGSPLSQMESVANAANINWVIDNNVIAIWPKGAARNGMAPLISAETGMIGYPSRVDKGGSVSVRTLFNPHIRIGGKCELKTGIPSANGQYATFDVRHELESQTPGGRWETSFKGSPLNTKDWHV